uniref:Chromodomain-helicase-DNA-binding protein 1-like n=1 Tax=Syphacia muris TaxID=451379 RepID=A0A0N5AHB5_9BILA
MLDEYKKALSLVGLSLQPHQISGVKCLLNWYKLKHGGIVADDMGLGKTCQTIAALNILKNFFVGIRSLIIVPLSVIDHWEAEIKRFGLGKLDYIRYTGSKEARSELQKKISLYKWNIFLTCHHYVVHDAILFKQKWQFDILVFDEAHRVKSMKSLLHGIIREIPVKWTLLLTGTPIQNNLYELYSLLVLVDSKRFLMDDAEKFVNRYKDIDSDDVANELRSLLSQYLLRRTKSEVAIDVPVSTQVILYHGITGLQRNLYRGILARSYKFLQCLVTGPKERPKTNIASLNNISIQLRKCVSHPYLFYGVEPEPFEEGEHLIEASGKLIVLDQLLQFLLINGHRALIFSQMTHVLDIVEDFLAYRGLSYKRLDGNILAEERYTAIRAFQKSDSKIFCFLLSTKAGGVGLTLTGADTVIFMDSDFNPQNDLQAAARCHRIGQTRPVKVIRLVAKNTIEEAIIERAKGKLQMTRQVLGSKSFEDEKLSVAETSNMILYGLEHLSEVSDVEKQRNSLLELEVIIGKSENGRWVVDGNEELKSVANEGQVMIVKEGDVVKTNTDSGKIMVNNMYIFEGHDYKKDKEVMISIINEAHAAENGCTDEGPGYSAINLRTPLTARQIQDRVKLAEKKKAELIEGRRKKQKLANEKKKELWMKNHYSSYNLLLPDANFKLTNYLITNDNEKFGPFFVLGDVTKPRHDYDSSAHAIIVHVVDNSGNFGRGGVFDALRSKSEKIEKVYNLAKRMDDLDVGYALLVEGVGSSEVEPSTSSNSSSRKESVVLLIAQDYRHRDCLSQDALTECFSRLANYAKSNACSIHFPRITYGMRGVQWYGIERLIRQHFTLRHIPTYIYYFRKHGESTHFSPAKTDLTSSSRFTKTRSASWFEDDNHSEKMEDDGDDYSSDMEL